MNNKRILSEEFSIDQNTYEDQIDDFRQPVKTLSQMHENSIRTVPTGENLVRIDNLLQSISADAHDSNMFSEEVVEDVKMEHDYVTNAILSFEQELIRKLNAKSKPEVKIVEPKEPVCIESTISSITDLLSGFSKEIEKTNIFSDEPVRFNPPSNILVRVKLPKKQQEVQSQFNFAPTIEISNAPSIQVTNVPPIEEFVPVQSNKPQKPEPVFVQTTFGVDNQEEFTLGPQNPNQVQATPKPQPQRRGLDMSDIYAKEMEYQRKLEEEEKKNKPTMTVVSSFDSAAIDLYKPEEEKSVGMQVSFTSDKDHDLLDSVDPFEDVPVMNNDINYDDIIGDLLDDKIVDKPTIVEEKINMMETPLIDVLEETPILMQNLEINDFPLLDEEPKVKFMEQKLPETPSLDISTATNDFVLSDDDFNSVDDNFNTFDDDYQPNENEFVLGQKEYVKEEVKENFRTDLYNQSDDNFKTFDDDYQPNENEFVLGQKEYVKEEVKEVGFGKDFDEEHIEENQIIEDTYEDNFKTFDEQYEPNENEFVLGQKEYVEEAKEVGFGKDFDEEHIEENQIQFERVFTPNSDEFVLGQSSNNDFLTIDDVADKEVFTSNDIAQNDIEPKVISIVNFNPRDDYKTISAKNCMDLDEEPIVIEKPVIKNEFIPRDNFKTISAKDCMDLDDVKDNVVKRIIKRTTITTTTKPKEYNLENVLFNVQEKAPKIEIITEHSNNEQLNFLEDNNNIIDENNIQENNIIEEPKIIELIEEDVDLLQTEFAELDSKNEEFDLSDIFNDEIKEEINEEKIETISPLEIAVQEQVEQYNLSGIFDDEDYIEPQVTQTSNEINEEPIFEEEYVEDVLEPGDLTISFDDIYIETDEDVFIDEIIETPKIEEVKKEENIEPSPLFEAFDLSDVFNDDISEQQSLDIEFDDLEHFVKEEVIENVVINDEEENPNQITFCNVYDKEGLVLNKDDFLTAFVDDCKIYDINANKYDKESIRSIIEEDLLIVLDRFGIKTNKLVLLRDLATAEKEWEKNNEVVSNVYNEFKKPVSKDELIKEYHTTNPHLYDAYRTKLEKNQIIELISSGELIVAEYGKKVDALELIDLLNDNRTSVFNRYNEQLTHEQLVKSVNEGVDLYDKYENPLTNIDLCIKIDSNLIDIKNENGNNVYKEELLKTVFGFLDVFNANKERMTKRVLVMYLDNKNLNIYNRNGVLLTTKQIIKVINENNIAMTDQHRVLLLGENSNVFDEEGNHFNRANFIAEYRNALPRIYNIDGKKINKQDIIDGINDGSIIIVDKKVVVNKDELVKELQLNIYGIFTKGNEELTKEELIEFAHLYELYDFKGKIINKRELIKKITNSELIVYDVNKNQTDIDEIISELRKEYIGVYDSFNNQLTKDELISNINANNKALFDDTKTLLSNDELNQLLISNNVDVTRFEQFFQTRNDKRDFIDINLEDNFVYTGDIYVETPNIVLARRDEDRLAIVSYNHSFEARLNATDDNIKDLYNLLKNKILSYNKVKCKSNWGYESYSHGKFQFAKVDIQDDKIYLFLPLNWNDFINTKYKYKDCSNKKNFEVTCLRFRITSVSELRDCFELIQLIASHIHTTPIKDYVFVNYYEKAKCFEQLLKEELIKEVVNSKKYSNLVEIDKTSLINNDITSINLNVIRDVPINEDLYNDTISNISSKPGKNRCIVYLDTISKLFHNEEVVSLESLKAKNAISNDCTHVKCVGRGNLNKKLVFELQEYTKDAIKMILLTNGIIK